MSRLTLEDMLEPNLPVGDSDPMRPLRTLLAQTTRRLHAALGQHVRSAILDRRFWESVLPTHAPVRTILELLLGTATRSTKLRRIELPGMHRVRLVPLANGGWPTAASQTALRGTEPQLAAALSRSTALTALSLHDNYIGPDGMLEVGWALRPCSRLHTLDLGRTLLGDSSAHSIAGVLRDHPALTFLDLSYNEDVRAEPSLDGRFHSAYEHLHVYGASVVAGALRRCTALTHLDLSNHACDRLVEPVADVLASLPALRSLVLVNTRIDRDGMLYLSDELEHATALTHLDVSRNQMQDEGAKYLATGLAWCTSLVSVHVEENDIEAEGFRVLVEALSRQSTLQRLNLSYSSMDDEGSEALMELLQSRCVDLQELTLRDLQAPLADTVWWQLKHCRSLTSLNLSNAQLDERALRHVAHSQINRILTWRAHYAATGEVPAALTTLDISRMRWNESTVWIVRMCRGLVSLDLSHASIDPTRCARLRGSLDDCPNLRDLVLHHNTIDAAAASALLETLEGLTTARTTVDLAENELTPTERDELFAGNATRLYAEYCERAQVYTFAETRRPGFH